MNKILKYLPLVSAVIWLICLIITIIKPGDYRIEFIISLLVLIVTNIVSFWSDKDAWKTERFDNKS